MIEDDDVGLGTITDYEMSETPAQKQAREKRTDDEKKGTVEELMERREQELRKDDEWKTLMRRENAPATYPVSDDVDLAAHPELAKARRRGYMFLLLLLHGLWSVMLLLLWYIVLHMVRYRCARENLHGRIGNWFAHVHHCVRQHLSGSVT